MDLPSARMFNLWDSILAYGEAQCEVGNVGNSGEFYTEAEDKEAHDALHAAEEQLIKKFQSATGYKPVYIKSPFKIQVNKFVESHDGFWMLEERLLYDEE